ncbi:MAG TPA: putative toxin-antitoxin system toxin component, PIN family [Anaerolineae bacterium]|nr:putative toxin-antitoxin system toxin component, PIN family [Anaerolineae bacterium]
MKVVLDTNVLIAAFITQGVCHDLLEHCVYRHQIILSDFILDELRQKLTGKFKYSIQDARDVAQLLLSAAQIVTPVIFTSPVSRDPDDDFVLGTAVAGHAVCIITGDKDLLVLERYQNIDIIKPADFAEYEAR